MLKSIKKDQIHKELKKTLDKLSCKELTSAEQTEFTNRKKSIDIYKNLLDTLNNSSASNEDIFLKNLTEYIQSIIKLPYDELHETMIIYLLSISTYIFDFFNTENLKDKKKHIKNIKKMFIQANYNIIKTYEKSLNDTISSLNKL